MYIHLSSVMLRWIYGSADLFGITATERSAKSMAFRLSRLRRCLCTVPVLQPDLKHSADEDRLIAVGRTSTGRPVFVAFTIRTKNGRRLIRPVTARYMHAKEIEAYEKEGATSENR